MKPTNRRPAAPPAAGPAARKGDDPNMMTKAKGAGKGKPGRRRSTGTRRALNRAFAERCAALVDVLGWSNAGLGRRAAIGDSRWTKWAKGENTVPLDEAARIAAAFGLTLDQLLSGIDFAAGTPERPEVRPAASLLAKAGIVLDAAPPGEGHEKSPAPPAPVAGHGGGRALEAALAALEAAAAALRAVAAAEAAEDAAVPRGVARRET